jgi:death-on-curing family protein
MEKPKVDIEIYEQLLSPKIIKDVNCFITEERVRRPDKENKESIIQNVEGVPKNIPNLDISKDDDYYKVINEGPLEGLRTNIKYKYSKSPELMEFVSFIIEYFAQNQIFGNGNKRTSFLIGYIILLTYQLMNDFEEILVPELNDELVELISNVAIREKNESKEDLKEFFSELDKGINQNWEK